MRIFRFVIRALPSANNAYRNQLQNGTAHIYVFAADSASAEARAHAYMIKHDWIPTEVEHAFEIQPQQSLDLDKHEALLYQRAQQHGIAADIVAAPFPGVSLGTPSSGHLS